MKRNNDNFKFFVPLEIEKAKDEQGKEVMKIAGIASTADRDSDGEVLDPSGFDLSYFMSNGFINWHHQAKDKPEAIIGEPTKAEIRKEGLYVEGFLYPESKLAREVYELAKGLEKSSSNRRLGFSIEGKVVERDLMDERFVKKAKITGLAVTPTPKNASTIVDILKGEFTDVEEFNTQSEANGGNYNVIDIIKPDGTRIVVDENYSIKIISKAATTQNASVLINESVESELKNQQYNNDDKEKNVKFATVNKSEVFFELLKATDDLELSKKVIHNIKFDGMNKPTVNTEELQKALSNIGVDVDLELLKGDDNAPENKNDENIDSEESDDDEETINKAIEEKEAELNKLKEKKASMAKSKKGNMSEEDIMSQVNEKFENVSKAFGEEISKANQDVLVKMTEMFEKFTQNVENRLSAVENVPVGRKSVVTANAIEKSFGGFSEMGSRIQLSKSNDRQQIASILMANSGLETGQPNDFYMQAALDFEATGNISKAIASDLYSNKNILITD